MDQLAEVCQEIAKSASRLRKVAVLADYLKPLTDEDFELAVRFLSQGPMTEQAMHETLFQTGGVRNGTRLSMGAPFCAMR